MKNSSIIEIVSKNSIDIVETINNASMNQIKADDLMQLVNQVGSPIIFITFSSNFNRLDSI